MFKPMLAGTLKPPFLLSPAQFPLLVSPKLDGVRATVQNGVVLSRSLKSIPNLHVQALFARPELEGLDGELIVGDPTAPDAFRKTMSAVMSERGKPAVRFYVFDAFGPAGFAARLANAAALIAASGLSADQIELVPHIEVPDNDTLQTLEDAWVARGFEGLMVRSKTGRYKQGRSTVSEGALLKVKRFLDAEGEVQAVIEQQHNGNAATINALGHTERSSHQAHKVGADMLGSFVVRNLETGVIHKVAPGVLTVPEQIALWQQAPALIGQIVKFKFFPSGAKDKPRFPQFQGFRDARDLAA